MDATQHCAAAKGHSEDAVTQIKTAADKMLEQITQLNAVISNIRETMSLIHGTEDGAITQAGNHMQAVKETVGSTTAGDIASGYFRVGSMVTEEPISAASQAIDLAEQCITACTSVMQTLDVDTAELERLKDQVETLASQLGA